MLFASRKIGSRRRGTSFREREMEHGLGHETMGVSSMRMPFGKHKGLLLKDIRVSYLEWVRVNVKGRVALVNEINKVLKG